ncbi:MAG: ATP synthase subunit I [Pigmentiphaga sp.]|uniref:ATP synthase subunit I n=1 Tax=Pigmentiphaga sp. TaxID=1977564 RepID=UPI0029B7D098|nr:ATP synthase subunit I [Pigmentiphaga sp.]MDX3906273.1 ATP synthase subunit I [Pigmentiphaga sp.]
MKTVEDDPRPSDASANACERAAHQSAHAAVPHGAQDGRGAGEPDPWGWEARDAERLRSNEQVEPLRLTEAERIVLRQQAVRDLLRAIIVQVAVSVVIAGLAYAVSGSTAAGSALAGAAAYVIPNALFAFRLVLSVQKPEGANPATFFLGEFLKIAIAAALIVAAARFGREWLVWPAFLAGLVCALKSQWLVLAFGKKD